MPAGACRLDMIRPVGMVKEQNIQLLTLLRSSTNPEAPWAWPKDDVFQTMFDDVIDLFDDLDIIAVALGARVDETSGIATVTLSTINLDLFYAVIDAIQAYKGVPDQVFVIYSKFEYVNHNTATIYVPKRFKRYGHRRIMRMLFSKYPRLALNYTLLLEHTFTEDIPGRRSRIDDQILVLGRISSPSSHNSRRQIRSTLMPTGGSPYEAGTDQTRTSGETQSRQKWYKL